MKRARETQEGQEDTATKRKRVTSIARLPPEILKLTFSFLGSVKDRQSVSLVCKQWNDLAWQTTSPEDDEDFALRWASARGDAIEVKGLLADPRVHPESKDSCAIRWASKYGRADVVKLLLEDGRSNPAARDHEAFYDAACRGHMETVVTLIQDRRVNLEDSALWPYYLMREDLLHSVADSGHEGMLGLILAHFPSCRPCTKRLLWEKCRPVKAGLTRFQMNLSAFLG